MLQPGRKKETAEVRHSVFILGDSMVKKVNVFYLKNPLNTSF